MKAAKRDEYLNEICGEDEKLRSEVELLLESFAKSEQFIETPAA